MTQSETMRGGGVTEYRFQEGSGIALNDMIRIQNFIHQRHQQHNRKTNLPRRGRIVIASFPYGSTPVELERTFDLGESVERLRAATHHTAFGGLAPQAAQWLEQSILQQT